MGDDEVRGGGWWVDEPIAAPVDDKLGRLPFVVQVGRLLDQVGASPSSAVVGLVGPWGSGKTSTLKLVVAGLDRQRWGVAEATPWALSGADAVVADLLAAVRAALPSEGRVVARARKALARYGVFAVPLLSVVPFVGSAAKDMSKEALARLTGESTVQQRTEEVAKELATLAKPVLIIIDDVDRLQPEQLLALFKAVRVLGRLPYVHYLLAYDEHTVLDVLGSTAIAAGNPDRALAFLEKVITLRLDQPPTQPAQIGQLFDEGLIRVLADVGATITEDQSSRLGDEREALLRPALTEPRGVARFLAQFHAYLPLVGPGEIDLVDFAVLTFLRVTHPRLYRELAADRAVLVGIDDLVATDVDAERLAAWRDPRQLANLDVPTRDQARVRAALERLFPALGAEETVANIMSRPTRRRDRRVSDPDHVERYFALVPPTGDLSDAVLVAALDEWTEARPGNAAGAVEAVLSPDPADAAACDLAARVLRRAEARTGSYSAVQAGVLMSVVLRLLPLPATTGVGGGPEDAAVAWLAQLLSKANGPPPADLLAIVERPADVVSPLWSLLRALRLALPERPNARSPQQGPTGDWFSAVVDLCVEAAWQRFLGHCRLGDAAPMEPAGGLLRWLDEIRGPAEVNSRLAAEVDAGLPIADLAARFVDLGTIPGTGQSTLVGFDGPAVLRRLGPGRVRAQRPALASVVPGDAAAGLDEDDVTWANRRRVAAKGLVAALDTAGRGTLTRLPVISNVEPNPLLNHQPNLLRAAGGQEPDLRLQVSVLLPGDHPPPPSNVTALPGSTEVREQAISELLAASPLTAWLDGAALSWHVEPKEWELTYSDGRGVVDAETAGYLNEEAGTGFQQGPPLLLGAQFRTGLTAGPAGESVSDPVLLFTVTVGIRLAELTADRRADEHKHSEEPLPAALTLVELYDLMVVLTRCAVTAQTAFSQLVEAKDPPRTVLIDLEFVAPAGLGAVVDLTKLSRIGTVTRTRYKGAFEVAVNHLGDKPSFYTPNLNDVAAVTLGEWLLQAGYRGYEQTLLAQSQQVSS